MKPLDKGPVASFVKASSILMPAATPKQAISIPGRQPQTSSTTSLASSSSSPHPWASFSGTTQEFFYHFLKDWDSYRFNTLVLDILIATMVKIMAEYDTVATHATSQHLFPDQDDDESKTINIDNPPPPVLTTPLPPASLAANRSKGGHHVVFGFTENVLRLKVLSKFVAYLTYSPSVTPSTPTSSAPVATTSRNVSHRQPTGPPESDKTTSVAFVVEAQDAFERSDGNLPRLDVWKHLTQAITGSAKSSPSLGHGAFERQ